MATSGGSSGGGLPSWFQSGAGSPIGTVTPSQKGAIYQDTTNAALYEAIAATSADWVSVGGNGSQGVTGVFENSDVSLHLLSSGATASAVVISDVLALGGSDNSLAFISNGTDGDQFVKIVLGANGIYTTEFLASGGLTLASGVTLFTYAGNPNTHVTALAKGDVCYDTSTPALWQASAAGSASWTEVGSGGAPGTTVESFITDTVSMSAGSPITITSVSLAAGTWEVTGRAQFVDGTSELTTCDLILSPTNNSVTGAYAGIGAAVGHITGADEIVALSITKSIVLAVTTTVYLIGYAGTSNVTANAQSATGLIGNCTGITAVRTA